MREKGKRNVSTQRPNKHRNVSIQTPNKHRNISIQTPNKHRNVSIQKPNKQRNVSIQRPNTSTILSCIMFVIVLDTLSVPSEPGGMNFIDISSVPVVVPMAGSIRN